MNVVVIDKSVNFKSKREIRRVLRRSLFKIGPGIFVGSLPLRSLNSLISEVRSASSKSTNTMFLIFTKSNSYGFKLIHCGSQIKDTKNLRDRF